MISWFSSCDTIIVTWLARFWSIIGLTLNVIFHNLNHKIRVHYIKPTPALSCLTVTHQNVRLLAKKALKWILRKTFDRKTTSRDYLENFKTYILDSKFRKTSQMDQNREKRIENESRIDRSWTEYGSKVDQNGLKFRKKKFYVHDVGKCQI